MIITPEAPRSRAAIAAALNIVRRTMTALDIARRTRAGTRRTKPGSHARRRRRANRDADLTEVIHYLDESPGSVRSDAQANLLRIITSNDGTCGLVGRRCESEGISAEGNAAQNEGEDGNHRRHDDGELSRD